MWISRVAKRDAALGEGGTQARRVSDRNKEGVSGLGERAVACEEARRFGAHQFTAGVTNNEEMGRLEAMEPPGR